MPFALCLALLAEPSQPSALVPDFSAGTLSPDRSLNYFLHVHKAGGTSMCELARANGEITTFDGVDPSDGGNCNGPNQEYFSATCSTTNPDAAAATSDHQRLLISGLTYVQNECTAPSVFLDHAVYATCVRHPLERAASSFYYNLRYNFDSVPGGATTFDDYVRRSNATVLREHSSSNFMTRFFSGSVGPMSKEMGAAELATAKATLSRMDVLLDLEHLDESVALLQAKFGWKYNVLPRSNAAEDADHSGKASIRLSAEAHRKLTEANRLDLELYAHAQAISKRQRSAAASPTTVRSLRAARGAVAASLTKADIVADGVTLELVR